MESKGEANDKYGVMCESYFSRGLKMLGGMVQEKKWWNAGSEAYRLVRSANCKGTVESCAFHKTNGCPDFTVATTPKPI